MDDLRDDTIDEYAEQAVTAVDLARTLSTWLFVGAAIALLAGLLGTVASWQTYNDGMLMSEQSWMLVSQISSMFTSSLLPAGLLAAAGAALRLQAVRIEAGS